MDLRLSEDSEEGFQQPRVQWPAASSGRKGQKTDEHYNDGNGRSTDPSCPHSGANIPGVQGEAGGDHEGEEDVERDRNRMPGLTVVVIPIVISLNGVGSEYHHRPVEFRCVPTEPRYVRQGKPIT